MQAAPLVIVNPVAGPNAQRLLERDRLRRALDRIGLAGEWLETTRERDADALIESHPGTGPVVIIGGDGTVQAAARALRGGDRPLCIVPRGSGNVLAQSLSLSPRLSEALGLLERGEARRVDVGTLDGEPVLLGVGMGTDARIVREADRQLKKQFGVFAYLVGAARTLPVEHHDFEIVIDGEAREARGTSVLVANFGTRIGPWTFPPHADGRDGALDVAVLRAETFEQTLQLMASPILPSRSSEKGVEVWRGRDVRVRTQFSLPVQVDGEDRGDRLEVHCTLTPGDLPVLVPRSVGA